MELLERIWEIIGSFFTAIGTAFERSITSLFGSSNARYIKKLHPTVAAINALEPKFKAMSDEELHGLTLQFRKRLAQGEYLTLAGGHMFPLERPQATAELLHSLLQRWDQRARQESP